MVESLPMFPLSWPAEKPGMQGGNELTGEDLQDARQLFGAAYEAIYTLINDYLYSHPKASSRLHKSYLNRLLEPFQNHQILVTATDWDNFLDLRSSRLNQDTQYEFRIVADAIAEALKESKPVEVTPGGGWHLPLCDDKDDLEQAGFDPLKVAVGRCARISYLTHFGERDPQKDVDLCDRLLAAGHASPFEHVCTPLPP